MSFLNTKNNADVLLNYILLNNQCRKWQLWIDWNPWHHFLRIVWVVYNKLIQYRTETAISCFIITIDGFKIYEASLIMSSKSLTHKNNHFSNYQVTYVYHPFKRYLNLFRTTKDNITRKQFTTWDFLRTPLMHIFAIILRFCNNTKLGLR